MQLNAQPRAAARAAQRGIGLMESTIALLVLAVGILGLASVQTRMLVEGRSAAYRATAIGLISDLTQRMALRRNAANASGYALDWSATAPDVNCQVAHCDEDQLTLFDLHAWRIQVAAELPSGNARVFAAGQDPRQIGVVVAWSETQGNPTDLNDPSPFAITQANSGVDCPARLVCHIAYVHP